MLEEIKKVLKKHGEGQVNLASDSAQQLIAEDLVKTLSGLYIPLPSSTIKIKSNDACKSPTGGV